MAQNVSLSKALLSEVAGAVADLRRSSGSADWKQAVRAELSVLRRTKNVLPWLLRARAHDDWSLLRIVLDHAREAPEELALEMGDERLSWADLADRSSRAARVLSEAGVRRGDVVALLGANSPSYISILLGISRLGAVAALINSHLEGHPLSHAIRVSLAKIGVVERRYLETVRARDDVMSQLERLFVFRDGDFEERMAAASASAFPRVPTPASSDYVYIYTSGTTGLPKPCKVTHGRSIVAGASFGMLLFQLGPGDKLYSVLPLYHSSALLLGWGSSAMTRTPLAMREQFSARSFWSDVQRYRATAMLYIGELCRYLVNTPPVPEERNNPLRIALGNGLRADVWPEFQRRFDIPEVREFYGATEAPGAIFNITGKVGSIGRVPFRRFMPMKLVRFDVDRDEHVLDSRGHCIECGAGEVGELLVRLKEDPASPITEFKGYTDPEATKKKILTDVFETGDSWYRSGDLLRFDADGFFYFVDRIGDTYRWKGENVSTAEVAEVLGLAPGVREATVAGVQVPGMEGQAGLAALVCEGTLDVDAFWKTAQELPGYAQPRFVRVLERMSTTGTFKIQKTLLRADGVDPTRVEGALYLRTDDGYQRLTPELWREVTEGRVRL